MTVRAFGSKYHFRRHLVMQVKPLKELLQDLDQEMLRLGYTEGSMKFYRNRWSKLTEFAEERSEIFFRKDWE
jgi:hypothetical protein